MKVEVEPQAAGTSTLRIELPADEVRKEWDAIATHYARHARIPGYRPGKAPKQVVEKKFRKEIQDELTQKLVSRSYHQAIERLREQSADFIDVNDRPLAIDDFAVIDFTGAVEGVPISDIAPEASKNLHGGKKFWLRIAADNFLPRFSEQIVGMNAGETRSVQVDFPAEFPVKELAGRRADYAVTLNEIKQKVLPPIDDTLAEKLLPGKTLADLRDTVRHNLEHEKEHELERAKESQIVRYLHERISFDLPPALLTQETRRALNELVHRNRERGVPDDMLKSKEKELVEGAGSLAAHRLKTNFILHRIAEQEKLEVTRAEIDQRIRDQAAHYGVTPDKMRKELEQNDRISGLAEELLLGKTLDFLKANVSVVSHSEPASGAAPAV